MSEENYQGRERRGSFRLSYPSKWLPHININGMVYAVIDISENGIRFYNPFHHRMPDNSFEAKVAFQDGEQIQVTARIVRYEPLMVAISLVEGIPHERMLSERMLLKKAD